jgi:hypothetical protein
MSKSGQGFFAIAMAGLVSAGAALAHEDAAIPNAWPTTPGNSMIALGPPPDPATPHKVQHPQRPVDKCHTTQGELYLKCRT